MCYEGQQAPLAEFDAAPARKLASKSGGVVDALILLQDVLNDFQNDPASLTWLVRGLLLAGQNAKSSRDISASLSTLQSMLASVSPEHQLLMALETVRAGVSSEDPVGPATDEFVRLEEIRARLADPSLAQVQRDALKKRATEFFLGREAELGVEALCRLADPMSSDEEQRRYRAVLMRILLSPSEQTP